MPYRLTVQIGQRFERLEVVSHKPSAKGHARCECKCQCGKLIIVRISALFSGNTKSCGCLNLELCAKMAQAKAHLSVYDNNGKIKTEYETYRKMKARCYNPNNKKYKDYGARGIVICDRWLESYANFLLDMGPKPSPKHTLDRKDVNGNYEPDNCSWATPVVQSNNKRRNVFLVLNGLLISQAQLAKALNISPKSVEACRNKGMTAEDIIYKYKQEDNVIEFNVVGEKIFAKD